VSRVIGDYRHMANRCLLLSAKTTDEQHKSVLLRAAAKFNELADLQDSSMHRERRISASRIFKVGPRAANRC
jgi:hypothetical protein